MYDEFGGREVCQKISIKFYARVAHDALLRPFFPKTFTCAIAEFTAFLAQFLDGPPGDVQRRWWLSLYESHRRFRIGPSEREAWLRLMNETLDAIDIPDRHRIAFKALFVRGSAYLIDQPDNQPIPELEAHWSRQLELDQAVAAIRRKCRKSIDATKQTDHFKDRPTIFAGLLAHLIRSGQAIDYVTASIGPDLAKFSHSYERTLLQEAAASGEVELVRHLLDLGADPNVLHALANECRKPDEGAILVHLLTQAGADVNAVNPKQRTTALHMAARRGSLALAQALIDCGAQLNLRDKNGDTPLRRALNCKHPDLAGLLRQHGATL